MTELLKIDLPVTPGGNDPADYDDATLEQLNRQIDDVFQSKSAPIQSESLPFNFASFALNGSGAAMEAKMLDDKFILGRMAILGQSTVMFAPPNMGKTLLVIWLLIQAIESGEIDGKDVFYINADDNHKGLTFKLKLAEKHGFLMLAPGYNDFRADMLADYLNTLVMQEQARGKVLILDTVKKFTDIMRKDKSSAFGETVRQFVAHGGSVIMLAHVNKHRNEEGKVVFAGTSDLVDDADCAYTLDLVTQSSGTRTVKFECFKNRGDVALQAVYEYDASESLNYLARLDSVRAVGDEERKAAEAKRQQEQRLERNLEAVEAIKECIREGINQKTTLVKEAASRSGVSKSKVARALREHTGSSTAQFQYWHVNREDKNAHVFSLNWGV